MEVKERRKCFILYLNQEADMRMWLTCGPNTHNNLLRTAVVNWTAHFVAQQLAEQESGRRSRRCN